MHIRVLRYTYVHKKAETQQREGLEPAGMEKKEFTGKLLKCKGGNHLVRRRRRIITSIGQKDISKDISKHMHRHTQAWLPPSDSFPK